MEEMLSAHFPPEPVVGAVVLDSDGLAWQRIRSSGWCRVGQGYVNGGYTWRALLANVNVRVIYTPPEVMT